MNIYYKHQKEITQIVLLLSIIGSSMVCPAQKIDLAAYKNKYPDDARIFLNYNTYITIEYDNDRLKVERKCHEETLCLQQKAAVFQSKQQVTFSGFYKLESLLAETKIGRKTIKVEDFDTTENRESYVFYDDVKSINFHFPKMEEGAQTILEYTHQITEPKHLSSFYFDNYLPVESAELSVTCPASVELGYKLYNCDSLHVEFTKTQSNSKVTYKWKAKNIKAIKIEENSPSFPYYGAHMFVYIKNYSINGMTVRGLTDLNDLHQWYHSMVADVSKAPCPALKALVDSLTLNENSEIEKVKKILYWEQDHIKYIAFEAGRGGFVPRNADLVYARRYGDCKDMANLIHKMLELAGIKSYLTWIGSRHLPYSYYDIPLPSVDNHMIVTYKADNQYYFIDGTTGQHPFNYPSSMIQGKQAFMDIDENKYEIANVPEINPELNLQADTLFIRITDKKITGRGISHFKGYSRVDMYDHLLYKDKIEQTTFLKNLFQKGNNKFLIDNFDIKNLDERDKDLIINYNFNLADYAQVIGNEIFLNMNMDKFDTGDVLKKDRKTDVETRYKKLIINHVILEIPKGYKLEFMPKGSGYKNDLFGYSIDYSSNNENITLTHKFTNNYLLLKPANFLNWNAMLESLKQSYKNSIILKKEN